MKISPLNQTQSQAMDLIDIILETTNSIEETPADMVTPMQAKNWLNKLSSNLCRLGVLEAEFESYYFRKMSGLRDSSKSNADAEMKAKSTNEYLVFRKVKNFRVDLYEKVQSVKRLILDTPDKPMHERNSNRQ